MESTFRISYTLKSDKRPRVHCKYFATAEKCRTWYVDQRGRFASCNIIELNYISFERLKMLAQLERECKELGCE